MAGFGAILMLMILIWKSDQRLTCLSNARFEAIADTHELMHSMHEFCASFSESTDASTVRTLMICPACGLQRISHRKLKRKRENLKMATINADTAIQLHAASILHV
jgi:hypothetical protein